MLTWQIKAYSSYNNDNDLRHESSSGGIFSLLSRCILESNGIVYGASYDSLFRVQHISITDERDLSKLRGAKYAQSKLGDTFKQVRAHLDSGRQVLFSGTPCQVVALKKYLKRDYDNLFCVDFVCHGVPLAPVWESYVKYRAKVDNNGNMPVKINLRSKHTGWSHYSYSSLYEYENGKKYSVPNHEDLFMRLFIGDYINMKACSNCHFKGYSRVSDITLGDFWGIWDIAPDMDDNKGTSLVMIQSEKGAALWEQIKSQTKWKEMTLEEASMQNPSILYSSPSKPNHDEIVKLCMEGKWDTIEKMLPGSEYPRKFVVIKSKLNRVIKKITSAI